MRTRVMMRQLLLWVCACGFAAVAQAHSVISAAYIEGEWIEGEVGFSNGDMALLGTPVQVLANGEAVGNTEIGEYGAFRWPITAVTEYRFLVDLSAGHVAEVVVSEDDIRDLATGLDAAQMTVKDAVTDTPRTVSAADRVSTADQQLEDLVATTVARQLQPLRKEIHQLRNKNDLRDILGGVGLIAGLFGVLYGFSAHRKLKRPAPEHND